MSTLRRNPSQSPLLKIVPVYVVLFSILFSACANSSSQTQPLSSHAQPTSTKSVDPTPTVSVDIHTCCATITSARFGTRDDLSWLESKFLWDN